MELNQHTLHQILNSVADPIFVKDRRHRWVMLNDACCEMIGRKREELIGKSDYDFFPKEQADVFWQKDEEVFKTGEENLNQEDITDAQGVLHSIVTKKTLYTDERGRTYIVGVIRDTSEHRKMEESLIELARSKAEREQLELFAYVASHDLREPLQSVIGFSDLLRNRYAPTLDSNAKGYLRRIQDSALRMSRLIDALLDFSKVSKRAELFARVDVGKVMAEILEDLDYPIRKSGAEVTVGKLPEIFGDKVQIRQLFQNLVSNALKFHSKENPPKIAVLCRELPEERVEIAVRDNGIGIDERYLERIFRPFERLNSRSEYEGNGIGLAVCQKIVAHHGGKITVKSKLREGSTFFVVLPKYQSS